MSNTTLALDEDTVGTLTLDVADVDLQFEGDSHTWSIVTAPNNAHGTASISGNKLTFTPVKDWNGTTTLTYRATDSKSATSNTATITITVRPVNDAPVASNRTLTTAEDTAGTVVLVANDVEGDTLTYSLVNAPNNAHGTVTISGDRATFTPKLNWNGTTTFTYRANDGKANSNTATVTVTVTPVNDAPSVSNTTLALDEDTVGELTLAVTDVDLQFEGDSHTWSIVTAPNTAHGTASISGNKLTFTPVKDWNGTTTLT
ncbi:Ig-like domain-containing protein, partial [Stutzerimonas frequens]|uniref:Ig-like domain-containing protein n=1 Tax=Stutzerimonas frequens TaxID=2968969 RepID=UPI001E3F8C87